MGFWAKKLTRCFSRLSLKAKIKQVVAWVLLGWFYFSLPAALFHSPASFVITDKDGNLLNASISDDGQWRFPFTNETPEKFIKCIVAFEDKRFYYHWGVDPIAMIRALSQNIKYGKIVSGGSTLTMQVIRLHKQNARRSLVNKAIECMLAVRMECAYRKKTILSLYACHAPFGGNVVGLEAASWRYFGRAANQLSWGEMAALAVLPNAPSLVHPGKNSAILLRKRNELLDKLAANKTIDESACRLAKLESLPGKPLPLPQLAPHLLDRLKKDFLSVNKNKSQPSVIQTTLDGHLQQQVNAVLNHHHQRLKGNQIKNAAALAVDIETGNILAYAGNVFETDLSIESHVDVLASRRSPGSTLKPLLYAAMLTEGSLLPQQLVPDIPTQMAGYTPQNFDLSYDGAVPADKALTRSLNIPAVKMLQQYKYGRFYEMLKKCGISTLNQPADHYGMSLILGGCEINPVELMGVYSSMARMYSHETANDGEWNEEDWRPLNYIHGHKPSNKKSHKKSSGIFDYVSLWHTFRAMTEVMRPGEEGLWDSFNASQRIAWKTGTSFGFRDGWAIGVTPAYGVLVWTGNTTGEGRPELIGLNAAAPVMFDIFRLLPPSSRWFRPPVGNFITMNVCRASGFKATPECAETDSVAAGEQSVQAANCPYCKKVHLDPSGKFRVNDACLSPSKMTHASWFILPPVIEHYYRQKHLDYKPLPPFMSGCEEDAKVLDIIYPNESAVIYVPVELSGEKGNTVFTATHKKSQAKLYWHLDNEYAGVTQNFHQLPLNPSVGKHVITIVDEVGNTARRQFKILEKAR